MAGGGIRIRSLGWAGAELRAGDATLLIDPLDDPGAVFAALGDAARSIALPRVVAPERPGAAIAGLVTHLHRDHADAAALRDGLAPGAPIFVPPPGPAAGLVELGLAQADHELDAAGLERRTPALWEPEAIGPFTITAVPAADGTGDPQVSWLIAADGVTVLHLGDTMLHGWWWRIALHAGPIDAVLVPINGARIDFPHRQPASALPAVLDPEQAAEAVRLLGARRAVPIHYDGYGGSRFYRPTDRALERFRAAGAGAGWTAHPLAAGEQLVVRA